MKKYFLSPLRGLLTALIVMLITLLIALSVYVVGALVWIIPSKTYRYYGKKFLHRFPVFWLDLIGSIVIFPSRKKWDIKGPNQFDRSKSYMLVSNHTSWLDIWVLSYAFHRKSPCIKFFLKKELLWTLPFAGLATWILGYPLLERRSHKGRHKKKRQSKQ